MKKKKQIELRQLFAERIHTKYRLRSVIYTDGSKTDSRTGFSVIVEGNIIVERTHNLLSIYSVESMAIIKALEQDVTVDAAYQCKWNSDIDHTT